MKRLVYVVLAVLLLVGVYGFAASTYAQDENSGDEQSSEAMSGEGTVSENPTDNPTDESTNDEAAPTDEQPPLEEEVYSCPQCGYTSDGPGDCPACNRSLVKGPPHTETDSTGGDSQEPTGDDSSSDSSSAGDDSSYSHSSSDSENE